MIVHQTNYLETYFDKQNDLFVQNWKKSPESNSVFKKEMLEFVVTYKKHKPSKALWLHKDFSFVLDKETQEWAEKHVVNPCVDAGNRKLAFVVSKDIFSHLSVIDSFEGLDIHMPRHFINEEDALNWLIDNYEKQLISEEPSIQFDGVDKDGNMILKIRYSENAVDIFKLFKNIKKDDIFYTSNISKFTTLTTREKEILFKYASGFSIQEISNSYNISILTVRTHWRNIKKKLCINHSIEAVKFLKFFN